MCMMKKEDHFLVIAYDTIHISKESGSQMVAVFFFCVICAKTIRKKICENSFNLFNLRSEKLCEYLRPWMEPHNRISQIFAVDVGVEFGGGD